MRTGIARLEQVTGRPFIVFCLRCETKLWAGDVEVTGERGTHYPVFADLNGEPFKAYYCAQCAEWIKTGKLQEASCESQEK